MSKSSKKGLELFTLPTQKDLETMNDMRKMVNGFDEYFGLDLENPVEVDYMIAYTKKKKHFVNTLIQLMNQFSNIEHRKVADPDYFVSGILPGIKTASGFMAGKTNLWRDGNIDHNSEVFKLRFLTILYSQLSKYLDDFVEMEYKRTGRVMFEDEDRYRILCKIIKCVTRFHEAYLDNEDTIELFMELEFLLSYRKNKVRKKVSDSLIEHINVLEVNRNFIRYSLEDDVLINDTLRLAYVAVTENPKVGGTFQPVLGVTFEHRRKIRIMLMNLGRDIQAYREKHPNRPLLYDCFIYAKPMAKTSFSDVRSNTLLKVGVRALYYLSFLANKPGLDILIQKIV